MLRKILKRITKTKSYRDYEQRRLMLDSVMATMFHEWAKDIYEPNEFTLYKWKKAQEASSIRNKFCNNHIIYTKVFDYVYKKELELIEKS